MESIEIIEIDTIWKTISTHPNHNLQTNIRPNNLCYIIYTSGSTGKPKGVMIEHKNLYSFITWCSDEFADSKFDMVYATTSICFDLSIFEIFYPLSIGKKIRILENGLQIEQYLSGDKSVLTNSVPVVIEHLLKKGIDLTNINVINMAGEPIPPYVQQELDTEKIEVRNLYGPTEDTTYSTVYHLEKNKPLLIGKPISNTRIYILDKGLHLCPVGIPGEIYIAGEGLARGYLNRPALTAEKFVKDNFSKEPDARMYKTGDLGRWLTDGNIEYLGREDDQVKIRGYRIELGEIESVLQQYEGVSQGVVIAKEDTGGNKRLIGYVVAKGRFDKEGIISYLKNKLPEYMVPAMWVELENLPLTPNGKIDRKALPDADSSGQSNDDYVAPRNELEIKLAEIWKQLLGIEHVGINDNFFELGGHSLLVMRVISAIRKEMQIELSIKDLFQFPTIKELSENIELEYNFTNELDEASLEEIKI